MPSPEVAEPSEAGLLDGIDNIGAPETPAVTPEPAPTPSPEPTPTPTPAPAVAEKPKLPFDDDFPAPVEKPKPQPQAAKKPVEIPEEQKSARGGTLKEFRENYETTKKERDELAQKLKALETAREEGTRAEIKKATEEYEKKLGEVQKRYDEAETRLRFVDYKRSDEYKDKFEKPLQRAWERALKAISNHKIELEDGSERIASSQDIQELLRLPDIAAANRATELFGSGSQTVIQHREKLLSLIEASEEAVEDYKLKGAEREREMSAKASQQMERVYGVFNETIRNYESADAGLYGRPEDPDAQKFWDAGDRLIALAVKRQGLDSSLPEEEQSAVVTKAQAAVAARARAFGPLRHRVMKLESELEELRGKHAKLSKSEPGQGSDRATQAAESEEDLIGGIDKL